MREGEQNYEHSAYEAKMTLMISHSHLLVSVYWCVWHGESSNFKHFLKVLKLITIFIRSMKDILGFNHINLFISNSTVYVCIKHKLYLKEHSTVSYSFWNYKSVNIFNYTHYLSGFIKLIRFFFIFLFYISSITCSVA